MSDKRDMFPVGTILVDDQELAWQKDERGMWNCAGWGVNMHLANLSGWNILYTPPDPVAPDAALIGDVEYLVDEAAGCGCCGSDRDVKEIAAEIIEVCFQAFSTTRRP